ncbi:hypothetical protein ACOME3_005739 [Neoechinorhynchus agilis]
MMIKESRMSNSSTAKQKSISRTLMRILCCGSARRSSISDFDAIKIPKVNCNVDSIELGNIMPNEMKKYLLTHEDQLGDFVANNIPKSTIAHWMDDCSALSSKGEIGNLKNSSSRYLAEVAALHARDELEFDAAERLNDVKLLSECIGSMDDRHKFSLLEDFTNILMNVLGLDGYRFYAYDSNGLRIIRTVFGGASADGETNENIGLDNDRYLCQYCAINKRSITISLNKLLTSNSSPNAVYKCPSDVDQIFCQPFVTSSGQLLGVAEMYKIDHLANLTDLHVSNAFDFKVTASSRRLSDFLLSVTKSIFKDMNDIDVVLMKILNFAKKLVLAERASLFLVDFEKNELYAKYFDHGNEIKLMDRRLSTADIRFPVDKGIAGHVAMVGESVNLEDAYLDKRFNRAIDEATGYRTKSLLCMPIWNDDRVIGVMELINKLKGKFTEADEKAFGIFAIYCGLAINHAQLYKTKELSEYRLKVVLEALTYHASYTETEVNDYLRILPSFSCEQMQMINFDPWIVSADQKCQCVEMMLNDLDCKIDRDTFIRFVLTVRKNYRDIPYHSWHHAFSVANATYAIIKNMKTYRFDLEEILALFVASLCHDLDHMGKTNSFMVQTGTALGALYTMSTMENHHFNRAVAILQRDDCNIFKDLDSSQYKRMIGNLKHCILSTDLELHSVHFEKLSRIQSENQFDFEDDQHRKLLMSLIMTAADLNVNYKSIDQQRKVLRKMMNEFYLQGDEQKKRGIAVVNMLDRDQQHNLPKLQLGFLSHICVPCFSLLNKLMPEFHSIITGTT